MIPEVTISASETGIPKTEAIIIIVAPTNSTETALKIQMSVISFPTVSKTLPPELSLWEERHSPLSLLNLNKKDNAH